MCASNGKFANRLQDMGESILVQSDDRRATHIAVSKIGWKATYRCLSVCQRKSSGQTKSLPKRPVKLGSMFAVLDKCLHLTIFRSDVRGPVSIHTATSIHPIDISSMQITKSVNTTTPKEPNKKGSDTMGMKHRVDFGVYVCYGSINTQLAEKTGFSREDAEKIKQALISLFENDASSARPDGSMEVVKVVWWEHNSISSVNIHRPKSIAPCKSNWMSLI